MKENDGNTILKSTDFGEIPNHWKFDRCEKAITFFGGAAFKSTDQVEEGIPWLKIANIGINKAVWDSKSFLPTSFIETSKRYLLNEGDLVMALTRPVLNGRLKITKLKKEETPALLNQRVAKVIVKNGNDLDFIYQLLQTPYFSYNMEVRMAGTDPPNIGNKDLYQIKIPLPPLPEQQKIAEILSTWDQAISTSEKLIEELKLRNKGLAQLLFTGNKRLKGFDKDWKKYHYSDILKKIKRPIEWNDETLYNLISVRRRSGGIFYRDALYGHQIKVKNLNTAKTGDFLFSKMQIVHGASALVTPEFDGAKISGSYISVRAKDESILSMEFFNWYSKLPRFYHQTFISSYGVHIEKMTFDFELFLTETIHLPSLEEQQAIVSVLKEADKELQLNQQQLDTLKEQKKGLMQKLLTGEIRVKTE